LTKLAASFLIAVVVSLPEPSRADESAGPYNSGYNLGTPYRGPLVAQLLPDTATKPGKEPPVDSVSDEVDIAEDETAEPVSDESAVVEPTAGKESISVTGVIVSSKSKVSIAVVRTPEYAGSLFLRVGSKFLGYRVLQITRRYVTMIHEETVTIKYEVGGSGGKFSETKPRDEEPVSNVTTYKQHVDLNLLPDIMMSFTALPRWTSDGKLSGFIISNITPGSLIWDSGLKNDDVVTSINGERFNSIPHAISLLESLKSEKKARVEYTSAGGVDKILDLDVN